jgi:hypothetical protein
MISFQQLSVQVVDIKSSGSRIIVSDSQGVRSPLITLQKSGLKMRIGLIP